MAVGNWNSITENSSTQNRTHGPTHEMLTVASQSITHDPKGNTTLIPPVLRPTSSGLPPSASRLTWDFDNKLCAADTNDDNTDDIFYKWDALGRRVGRDDGNSNVIYFQDGQQTLADYTAGTSATNPTYKYVFASYIDEIVARIDSSDDILYFNRNQQYSITAVSDGGGEVVEQYAYSAYGQVTIADASGSEMSDSAISNRYTYTGREWDEGLSLYHYRARMYDAVAGRFVTRDPIEYDDGPNSYAYLSGSALTFTDSTGLCKEGWNGNACVNYTIWVNGTYYAESDHFNKKWWINRGAYFRGMVKIFASLNDSINCCCPKRSVAVNINNSTTLNVQHYQVSTRLTTVKTLFVSLFGPAWVKALLYGASGLDIAENLKQAANIRDKAGNAVAITPAAICSTGISSVNATGSQTFTVKQGAAPGGFPNTSTERKIRLAYSGKTCES